MTSANFNPHNQDQVFFTGSFGYNGDIAKAAGAWRFNIGNNNSGGIIILEQWEYRLRFFDLNQDGEDDELKCLGMGFTDATSWVNLIRGTNTDGSFLMLYHNLNVNQETCENDNLCDSYMYNIFETNNSGEYRTRDLNASQIKC